MINVELEFLFLTSFVISMFYLIQGLTKKF